MSKPIQIDVEAILASKAGDKARFVPRFLISYLKKIIHQDEVNGFLDCMVIKWIMILSMHS